MNVYVAGPMRGKKDQNIAAFHRAAALLRLMGHTVFNPADNGSAVTLPELRHVFGADTAWITATADAIALLPGWEGSKGATAEAHLGFALGLRVEPIEAFYAADPVLN